MILYKPLNFKAIRKFSCYFLSLPQKETKKFRQKEASTRKASAHLRSAGPPSVGRPPLFVLPSQTAKEI